jgi:hypothetical protein
VSIFSKLNLKDQAEILVLNAPESFEPELATLAGVKISRDIGEADKIAFSLAFVMTKAQLDAISTAITGKAQGDAILWMAYPKVSSKKYHCDFNRDTGWDVLAKAGFQPVRQVAIDEDWSGLRFRRVDFIGT